MPGATMSGLRRPEPPARTGPREEYSAMASVSNPEAPMVQTPASSPGGLAQFGGFEGLSANRLDFGRIVMIRQEALGEALRQGNVHMLEGVQKCKSAANRKA